MNSILTKGHDGQPRPSHSDRWLRVGLIDDDLEFQFAVRAALLQTRWALHINAGYGSAPGASWLRAADVVLLGACGERPEGLRCLRELKASQLQCPVVIASGEADAGFVCECFASGAWGYLLKPIGAEALVRGLADAAAGVPPLAPPAAAVLVSDANGSGALRLASGLSPRQWDIARLRARGLSEGAIANRLDITPLTVHTYLKQVHARLGVHDRRALALKMASMFDARVIEAA